MVRIKRVINVCKRLRLNPLGAVDNQKRPLNSAHGARYFIGKIDVTGGVDQVKHICLAVLRHIINAHSVGLNSDAALALDIHAIQHLRLHVPFGDGVCLLDQTVSKGGFTVVNMGHDREIADVFQVGHWGQNAYRIGLIVNGA